MFVDSQCKHTTRHDTPQHITTRMYGPGRRAAQAQQARSRSRAGTDRDEKQEEQTGADRQMEYCWRLLPPAVEQRAGSREQGSDSREQWMSSQHSRREAVDVNNKGGSDRKQLSAQDVAIATAGHDRQPLELCSGVL